MSGTVLQQARLATMVPGGTPYGLIEDGALAISKDGRFAYTGPRADLPSEFPDGRRSPLVDAS